MSERRYQWGDKVWVELSGSGRCKGFVEFQDGYGVQVNCLNGQGFPFTTTIAEDQVSPRDPEPAADRFAAPGKVVEPAHPHSHYFSGGMEAIDVIRAFCTPEEIRAWAKIASTLYLLRDGKKSGTNDVEKAHWHLAQALEIKPCD